MRSKTKNLLKRYAKRLAEDYNLPTQVYYKDDQVVRDRTFIDEDGNKNVVPCAFSIRKLGLSERGTYQYLKKLYKRFHGNWDKIFEFLTEEAKKHEQRQKDVV